MARSHGVTSRSVVDRETTTDARGTRLLDPNAEFANIDARHARATRKNRSSGLKDRAKTSLSISLHPSNSSSKPREGKKTRGDEKSSTRLSSPDLGKVQIIFISMECGGEGARLECKYGEGEKIFFPPRDAEVDYRFVTEWLFTQEASSWLNTRPMAGH